MGFDVVAYGNRSDISGIHCSKAWREERVPPLRDNEIGLQAGDDLSCFFPGEGFVRMKNTFRSAVSLFVLCFAWKKETGIKV